MIRIENLNKYYNRHRKNQIHVINDTNITLPDKGLISLLGNSGSGKTTLLNAIGGLDKVNKGNIYIDNYRITRRSSRYIDKVRNLNIGYIFQDYKLIDNMSVYDNVALVLKMIGVKDKKEIKKRVEYILSRLGIYRYRYRPCEMLSGGERQRVGIARALVKNPDIILADEPTGNLDSKNTIEIMNIIKSISKDKLVIMVTHEVDLAKFYSDRIITIVDGKVFSDKENSHDNELDYRIDNKIYLKDFNNNIKVDNDDIKIDYYSDNTKKLNLVLVYKNGNLYIKNKDDSKIEIIDNSSSIELIDDHYKKIDKDTYSKYSFDYENIINKGYKLKYSSIFNIFTIFSNGFRKVFDYSILKKILLIGFFLSSIFVTYSISNILGIIDINDSDFVTKNKDYLYLDGGQTKVINYLEYLNNKEVEYMIPGDSIVRFSISGDKYYQTKNENFLLSGSLSSINMINDKDIIIGRMPTSNKEIVIDKIVYDNTNELEMIGIYTIDRIIDTNAYIKKGLLEYKIVGIVDKGSPSIYTDNSEFINILSYTNKYDEYYYDDKYSSTDSVFDYSLYKDRLSIVKGRSPVNNYEVIVNEDLSYIFKLDKDIDEIIINGNKLRVVGYYKSIDDINGYFVNSETKKYQVIEDNRGITIYSNDKDKLVSNFKDKYNVDVKDVYERDKSEYKDGIKDKIKSSLTVASVILIISLIEIVLMIRSSFLSRIKEVGIYRAIGVKKLDIYKMFMGESFAITTLVGVPGVLFMSYCIYVLSSIKIIANNYMMNIYVVILCLIIIYLFNIIVGLIPVFNTIRKTPASILSRHEVD